MPISCVAATDYVSFDDSLYLEAMIGNAWSFFAWVKCWMLSTDQDRHRITWDGGGTSNVQITISGPLNSGGFAYSNLTINRVYSGGGTDWETPFGSLPADDNRWHSVAVCYADDSLGTTPTMYIDGLAQTTTQGPFTAVGSPNSWVTANVRRYGNRNQVDNNMATAHVAWWNRNLSAVEITNAHRRGPLSVRQGLVLYYPFDEQQVGGAQTVLVGPRAKEGQWIVSPQRHTDPYNYRYVGAWNSRRLSYQNHRARAKQITRAWVPVASNYNNGWIPTTDATRVAALIANDASEASTTTDGASMSMKLG